MADNIELQNDEFRALELLIDVYKIHQVTAVVDNDYPAVRSAYERTLREFLMACARNGRMWKTKDE